MEEPRGGDGDWNDGSPLLHLHASFGKNDESHTGCFCRSGDSFITVEIDLMACKIDMLRREDIYRMKLKIIYLIPVVIIAGFLMLYFIFLRPAQPWNHGVEDTVAAISRGVIDRDLRAIISRVDRNYDDAYGNKYEDIKLRLILYFRQQGTPTVDVDIMNMKRKSAQSATAVLKCNLIMPGEGLAYNGRVQVNFSRKGHNWVVSSARLLDDHIYQELQEK